MPGGQHKAASALADPTLHLRGASLPCSSSMSHFRLSEGGRGQGEATTGRAFHTSKPCLVRRSLGCLAVLSHRGQRGYKDDAEIVFLFPSPSGLGAAWHCREHWLTWYFPRSVLISDLILACCVSSDRSLPLCITHPLCSIV